MNTPSLRSAPLMRFAPLFFLFWGFKPAAAQTASTPLFYVNFSQANPADHQITFQSEAGSVGTFDFVVRQADTELFRFRDINTDAEKPYSFTLVNDKNKSLEGLKERNTLTNYSNFALEISTAFEDKALVHIGILECRTAKGATSRMQVVKMVLDEESIGLTRPQN